MKLRTRIVFGAFTAGILSVSFSTLAVVRNDGTAGTISTSSVQVTAGGFVGSGTIITRPDGNYILTAAHNTQFVGGGNSANYTFTDSGGLTRTGTGPVIGQFNQTGNTVDWAVIKLASNFPVGDTPLALYAGAYTVDTDQVTFTGYGLTAANAGSGLFTPNSTGTARQGANTINYVDPTAVGFDFDSNNVAFIRAGATPQGTINGNAIGDTDARDGLGASEATTFGGDSGMGYLRSGQVYAVHDGITRGRDLNLDQAESYGTRTDVIAAYLAIPEPGSMALIAIGAVGLLARRQRGA